jgi:hypothetical protein
MFTSQPEKSTDTIIALVVLDLQKLRVRIVLAPETIRELLRELEHPMDHQGERQGIADAPGSLRTWK